MHAKRDFAAAEPLLREALGLSRGTLGNQHPNTSIAISNLATVLKAKGDLAAAEPLLRESRLAPRFLELTASTLQ